MQTLNCTSSACNTDLNVGWRNTTCWCKPSTRQIWTQAVVQLTCNKAKQMSVSSTSFVDGVTTQIWNRTENWEAPNCQYHKLWCFADRASRYNLSNWPTLCKNSCFIISLLYSSTCFEHCCAHHQELKLYYTASSIVIHCRWPSVAQVDW